MPTTFVLDERARTVDGAIDVRFGGEVEHGVGLLAIEDGV